MRGGGEGGVEGGVAVGVGWKRCQTCLDLRFLNEKGFVVVPNFEAFFYLINFRSKILVTVLKTSTDRFC